MSNESNHSQSEVLDNLFREFVPRKLEDFKYQARKFGATPGGVYESNGTQYVIKDFHYASGAFPDQGLNDYLLSGLMQRILFDRAPFNNVVTDTHGKKMVSSKMLNRYDYKDSTNNATTKGFAKIIAATSLILDQDSYKEGNVFVIKDNVVGKVDHGVAGYKISTDICSLHQISYHMSSIQQAFSHEIDFIELVETFRQITLISDDEIETLILRKAQVLGDKHYIGSAKELVSNMQYNKTICAQYLHNIERLCAEKNITYEDIGNRLSVVEAGAENNVNWYDLALEYDVSAAELRKSNFSTRDPQAYETTKKKCEILKSFGFEFKNIPPSCWETNDADLTLLCQVAFEHGMLLKDLPTLCWSKDIKKLPVLSVALKEALFSIKDVPAAAWDFPPADSVRIAKIAREFDIDFKQMGNAFRTSHEKAYMVAKLAKEFSITFENISRDSFSYSEEQLKYRMNLGDYDFKRYQKCDDKKIKALNDDLAASEIAEEMIDLLLTRVAEAGREPVHQKLCDENALEHKDCDMAALGMDQDV